MIRAFLASVNELPDRPHRIPPRHSGGIGIAVFATNNLLSTVVAVLAIREYHRILDLKTGSVSVVDD